MNEKKEGTKEYDECTHCSCKGDIEKCRKTECNHHENWYSIEQQKEIRLLKEKIKILNDIVTFERRIK